MKIYPQTGVGWLRKWLLLIPAVLILLLVSACGSGGGGNSVHVYDNANVLDQNKVQSAASNLSKPIDIYTVNSFTGTKSQFDQATRAKLGNNPDLIVVAIDTVHHHLAIVRGANVSLSQSQIQAAVSSFAGNYGNGDYTGATVSTIDSLSSSIGSPAGSTGGGVTSGLLGTLCVVGIVILGLFLLVGLLFRRRRGSYAPPPVYQPPYQPPYNQGYPPNNYGPGYNQGQGMNPWAAGGLGAAAGGLLGYELGRQSGENEAREQGQGDGGWAGASGDFGGGSGGDFGSGGGDFGGGSGDFGGGGGGDFGGGGGGGNF